MNNQTTQKNKLVHGIIAAMPLSIAVIPWGVLLGALAVQAGLTPFQAQLTSLIVFAGAAQISGVAVMGAAGSWLTLLNSTAMISVRHVLYSATYKKDLIDLPFYKRFFFAFLLTDEMFAIAQTEQLRTGKFDYWFAMIVGFTFYIIWNLATLAGIVVAKNVPNIDNLGFDFAIVATFLAMLVPMVKESEYAQYMFIAAVVSGISAFVFELLAINNALVFAGLIGMALGGVLMSNAKQYADKSKDHKSKDDTNQDNTKQGAA